MKPLLRWKLSLALLYLWVPWGKAAAQVDDVSIDDLIHEIASLHRDQPDEALLRNAALNGILQWLMGQEGNSDMHLLSRDDVLQQRAHARGERYGVGVGMLIVPEYGIRLMEIFDGTPAAAAGLKAGDVVVAVDTQNLQGRSTDAILHLLNDRHRKTLVLDVLGSDGSTRRMELEKSFYVAPAFSITYGDGYELLRIHHFGQGVAEDLENCLATIEPGDALVVDLRDTNEGLLNEAVATAGLLSGGHVVVGYLETPGGSRQQLRAPKSPPRTNALVFLVNSGTRGLAEMLVGALAMLDPDVVLVGTRTAGYASLPVYINVGENHMLKIAGAKLLFPDGTNWQGLGLIPDVEVLPYSKRNLLPPPALPPDLQVDTALRLVGTD